MRKTHLGACSPQGSPVKSGKKADEDLGPVLGIIVLGEFGVLGMEGEGLVGDLAGLDGAREEV